MTHPPFFGCFLGAALLLATQLVSAQPAAPALDTPAANKELARGHFERGIEAFRADRHKDAIDAFLDANRLYPSAAISFNIARAYEKLDDVPGALRFFRDYLRREPEAADREQILGQISELEDLLRQRGVQQVSILSTPEGATLVLDGQAAGVTPWTGEIRPGIHEVVLRLKGYQSHEERFDLSAHRALDLSYTLARPKSTQTWESSNQTTLPATTDKFKVTPRDSAGDGINPLIWVTLGASGVALGGAAWFEISSASSEEKARKASTQNVALGHIDDMQSSQSTARILAGVGGALAIGGGIWLWTDLSREKDDGSIAVGCIGLHCRIQGEF